MINAEMDKIMEEKRAEFFKLLETITSATNYVDYSRGKRALWDFARKPIVEALISKGCSTRADGVKPSEMELIDHMRRLNISGSCNLYASEFKLLDKIHIIACDSAMPPRLKKALTDLVMHVTVVSTPIHKP